MKYFVYIGNRFKSFTSK